LTQKMIKSCIQHQRTPPNTGTTYTRGTDLKLHVTQKGTRVFYLQRWSMWQGESGSIELISEDQAKKFFTKKLSATGWDYPSEFEIQEGLKLWPDLMNEEA